MSLNRAVRNIAKKSFQNLFVIGQRVGVDLLPRHWGSPISSIPDLRRLTAWRKPLDMIGVNGLDLNSQLRFLERCCTPAMKERMRAGNIRETAMQEQGDAGYGPTEADLLFCYICTHRPGKIVQIGAGVSTSIILTASRESNHKVEMTCVDPYPSLFLRRLSEEGKIKLIGEKAQEVAMETFLNLGPGDLLFIDSSHAVRPDSEVTRLILEVLPRIAKGTHVHFHDINFPYTYPRDMLIGTLMCMETAFLHAYLANNSKYAVLASLAYLHYASPKSLAEFLVNYIPAPNDDGMDIPGASGQFPSAIYLEVVS